MVWLNLQLLNKFNPYLKSSQTEKRTQIALSVNSDKHEEIITVL